LNILLFIAIPGVAKERGQMSHGDRLLYSSSSFPALAGLLAGSLGRALLRQNLLQALPSLTTAGVSGNPEESFPSSFGSDSTYRSLSQEPEKAE
jgi:hypothetical protein